MASTGSQGVTAAAAAAANTYHSPPHDDFLLEGYKVPRPQNGKTWGDVLREYSENKSISFQERYATLKKYIDHQKSRTANADYNKKMIALGNRRKGLLKNASQATNTDVTAGCVLIFSDGKAFYTVKNNENGNPVLGFPKGEIEYFPVSTGNVLTGATKEDSVTAALRELKEETGFYPDRLPASVTNVNQPFAATLLREVDGNPDLSVSYTIEEVRSYRISEKERKFFYLLFFLNEPSPVNMPNLKLTQNAKDEGISGYRIEEQKKIGTLYNSFSKVFFTKQRPIGGRRRQTRKSKRTKRRTTRRRG